jgi:hypothetical protein
MPENEDARPRDRTERCRRPGLLPQPREGKQRRVLACIGRTRGPAGRWTPKWKLQSRGGVSDHMHALHNDMHALPRARVLMSYRASETTYAFQPVTTNPTSRHQRWGHIASEYRVGCTTQGGRSFKPAKRVDAIYRRCGRFGFIICLWLSATTDLV